MMKPTQADTPAEATSPSDAEDQASVDAKALAAALRLSENRTNALREARTAVMTEMHTAGRSWAEIARLFGLTPQAAMYATGYAKRTVRRKG